MGLFGIETEEEKGSGADKGNENHGQGGARWIRIADVPIAKDLPEQDTGQITGKGIRAGDDDNTQGEHPDEQEADSRI